MSGYYEKLGHKIRESVSVYQVMRELGVWEGPDATKQIRCPFHGKDGKPSAKVHKDSGIMWCFVCENQRYDAIRYAQCSLGSSYHDTLDKMAEWFNIKVDEDTLETLEESLENSLDDKRPRRNSTDLLRQAEEYLVKKKGKISFKVFLNKSNLLDQIEIAMKNKQIEEHKVEQELGNFLKSLDVVS